MAYGPPEPEPVLLADRDDGGEVQTLAPRVLIEGEGCGWGAGRPELRKKREE